MHIITASHLSEKEIKKYADGRRGFIVFSGGDDANDLCRNLESHGFERISLSDILLSCRSELRQSVIDFTGALNCQVPHPNWWANNLSRRIAMYSLPTGLAKLFLLRTVIDRNNWDCIIVIDSSYLPWSFLNDNDHDTSLNFSDKHGNKDRHNILQERFPIKAVLWAVRKVFHRFALAVSQRKQEQNFSEKNNVTLLTLIDRNCFPKGSSFRDIYLGELAPELRKKGYSVHILARLLGTISKEVFKGLRSSKDPDLRCIDSFWTFKELFQVAAQTVKDFFAPAPEWNPHIFMGFDVRSLLSALWRIEVGGAIYADALLDGYAFRRYVENIPTDTLMYPYENKTYERIILQAGKDSESEIYTTGYQHAVLTPKHIHMFMAEGEADVMPLPDRIVTNGPWTAKMLNERGFYNNGTIAAGTALRFSSQGNESAVRQKPPEKVHNVLVALAEGAEEYDRAFSFLRALQDNSPSSNFLFRVRLHPSIPYDPFKKQGCGKNCIRDKEPSLEDSLQQADVLLYASTSVAVHAMSLGIPVVWMDLLDFWGTDPVEGNELLRWELVNPAGWDEVIKKITSLPEQEFQKRLGNSIDFAKGYFCRDPVDVSVFFGRKN